MLKKRFQHFTFVFETKLLITNVLTFNINVFIYSSAWCENNITKNNVWYAENVFKTNVFLVVETWVEGWEERINSQTRDDENTHNIEILLI